MQRHSTPPSASSTCARLRRRRARQQSVAAISMPGVQMPHWAAPWARKACAQSVGEAARSAPSTVSMVAPSACAVGTRQAQTCAPSRSTVQAPQSPASQPILVPVRPSSSRSVVGQRRERSGRDAAPACR